MATVPDVTAPVVNTGISQGWGQSVADITDFLRDPPSCRLYTLAGPGIATSTLSASGPPAEAVKVNVGSVSYDNDSMSFNNGFKIQTAGKWTIHASVEFMANYIGVRSIGLYETTTSSFFAYERKAIAIATPVPVHLAMFDVYLPVGHTFELKVAQNSGSTVNLGTAYYSATLSARWVGIP